MLYEHWASDIAWTGNVHDFIHSLLAARYASIWIGLVLVCACMTVFNIHCWILFIWSRCTVPGWAVLCLHTRHSVLPKTKLQIRFSAVRYDKYTKVSWIFGKWKKKSDREKRKGEALTACSRVKIYRTRTCTNAAKSQTPKEVYFFFFSLLPFALLSSLSALPKYRMKGTTESRSTRTLCNVYLIRLFVMRPEYETNLKKKKIECKKRVEKRKVVEKIHATTRVEWRKELQIYRKKTKGKKIKEPKAFRIHWHRKQIKWQSCPFFSFLTRWLLHNTYFYRCVAYTTKPAIQMHSEPRYIVRCVSSHFFSLTLL